MAEIILNPSNNPNISFDGRSSARDVQVGHTSVPKYVGARATVTRTANSIVIWMKDYKGETTETIAEAIQSITTNDDGSLTFTLPDGRTITTGSLKGDKGDTGDTGAVGNGIASIEKTSTSGLADTYTITYTNGDTDTFIVTNGKDGIDGTDGADGVGIASISKTGTSGYVDTYTITYTDGDTDSFTVTNGKDGEDGADGQDGADGHSPVITGSKTGKVSKIYSDGTEIASINDGNDGASGSQVSVTRYTTTGTHIADITVDSTTTEIYAPEAGGQGTVTDVTVDGTSVLSGSVAVIDLTGKANVSDLATVATSGDYDDLLDKPTIPALGKTIPYGECSTGSSTVAKTVTITGVTELTTGLTIAVKFSNYNSATNPTLQVNSLTAKQIMKYGTTVPGTSAKMSWYSGSVLILVYDGTYWQIVNWDNADTTYSALTQSDMQTGTATTGRLITAARLKEAILYHETGEPNVQSDWNQTDTDADDYIKNKPTIPTDTGDLTNGAGFITGYTETDPIFSASAASGISSSDISNWNGKSDFSGSYNDLTDKPKGYGSSVDITSYTSSSPYTVASDGVFQIFCTYRSNNYIQGYVDGAVLIQASTPASQNAAGNILNCVPVFKGQNIYAVKSSNYSYAYFYPYI